MHLDHAVPPRADEGVVFIDEEQRRYLRAVRAGRHYPPASNAVVHAQTPSLVAHDRFFVPSVHAKGRDLAALCLLKSSPRNASRNRVKQHRLPEHNAQLAGVGRKPRSQRGCFYSRTRLSPKYVHFATGHDQALLPDDGHRSRRDPRVAKRESLKTCAVVGVAPLDVPHAEGAALVTSDGALRLVLHDDHADEGEAVSHELHLQVTAAAIPAVGVEIEPRRQDEIVLTRISEGQNPVVMADQDEQLEYGRRGY